MDLKAFLAIKRQSDDCLDSTTSMPFASISTIGLENDCG